MYCWLMLKGIPGGYTISDGSFEVLKKVLSQEKSERPEFISLLLENKKEIFVLVEQIIGYVEVDEKNYG